jgi:hypothetical protein
VRILWWLALLLLCDVALSQSSPGGNTYIPGSVGQPGSLNNATGTPASITLTNGTGLPLSGLASQAAGTVVGVGANASGAQAPGVLYRTIHYLTDYGAKCDGTTDDTTAINAWLASLSSGVTGYAPMGTCIFTAALTANNSGFSLYGAGAYSTIFKYTGASTTIDLLTVGNSSTQNKNVDIEQFRITSSTVMTAGTAIHIELLGRSMFRGIVVDGQDGTGNFWNGIWFDRIDSVSFLQFEAVGQHDAFRVNGATPTGPKADLYVSQGKIGGSGVGMRVGGAFGGLVVNQVDDIGNGQNLIIDTTLSAEANRELVFGAGTFFDSSTSSNPNVEIADTLAGSGAYFEFDGPWIASGVGNNLQIDSGVSAQILLFGGTIFNGQSNGVYNASSTPNVNINGTWIRNNAGYGAASAAASTGYQFQNIIFGTNTSGNTDSNTKVASYVYQNSQRFTATAYFQTGGAQFLSGSYLSPSSLNNQTATGTNAATAFGIGNQLTEFSTVASGTGAILASAPNGTEETICNRGANTLLVYPPTGNTIEGLAASAAYSVPATTFGCYAFTVTNGSAWFVTKNALGPTNVAQTFTASQTSAVAGGGTSAAWIASSANPAYTWYATGAGTDAKTWDAYVGTTSWTLRLVNDAQSSAVNALNFSRSGATITDVALGNSTNNPTLHINGTAGVSCSGTPTSSFASVNGIVTHC